MKKEIFHNMDVVRTLLACLVACGHFFLWNHVDNRVPSSFFLAVDFFFVLSGFVLSQSVLADHSTSLGSFLTRFSLRRFFRLYPLYICLFVACIAALMYQFGRAFDPFYYSFISAFLLQAMGLDATPQHIFNDTTIGIAWSISVEFWVGIPFFCCVYALRKNASLLAAFALASALIATMMMVNYSPNQMNVNLQKYGVVTFGALRGILGFGAGCTCFLAYKTIEPLLKEAKPWIIKILELLAVALPLFLFCRYTYSRQNEFVAPYLFAFVLFFFALNAGWISHLFSSPLFSMARPLSYSVYLVHPFYVLIFRKFWPHFDVGSCVIYLTLVVGTAAILYKIVEERGIAHGRRFGRSEVVSKPEIYLS
jgi:peptidoglycan/LPS O-acetylase OafA/YrhL